VNANGGVYWSEAVPDMGDAYDYDRRSGLEQRLALRRPD
jgi:hypothetical protein